jgi:CRISPR-associated protein Cas1
MIRRVVEISREPCHLAVRDGQLLVLRRDGERPTRPARPSNLAGSIPLEDLGVLMVDERSTTYSHSALAQLAEHGCALVVCGRDHAPTGLYLPLSTNTEVLSRLETQLAASKPTCKRLWSALVVAKIRAQAAGLGHAPAIRSRLLAMTRRVRSGDPTNVEAQAARAYWSALFAGGPELPAPFRRRPGEPGAPPPNNLLDYGYAVLRAAVARAIVSAGLLPALGIRHHNRSNAFCLADDLVEPLRPIVDSRVRELVVEGRLELDQPTKAEILMLLSTAVQTGERTGPLQVSLATYIASFVRALEGDPSLLVIPAVVAVPRMCEPSKDEENRDGAGEDPWS